MPTGDIVILVIVVGVLLVVTALGGITLWSVVNPTEWTAAGWGSVGTWVAGLATAASVAAAVIFGNRQTKQSREAVEQQLRQAEALHAAQMAELKEQLDTTVRLHEEQLSHDAARQQLDLAYANLGRQFDAIETLWQGIGRVVGPLTDLKIRIERINRLSQTVDENPDDTESTDERDRRRVEFAEWAATYQNHITQAQLAFTGAHLWLTDAELRQSMRELEATFNVTAIAANTAILGMTIGHKAGEAALDHLDSAKSKLLTQRGPMLQLAAERLAPSVLLKPSVPTSEGSPPDH